MFWIGLNSLCTGTSNARLPWELSLRYIWDHNVRYISIINVIERNFCHTGDRTHDDLSTNQLAHRSEVHWYIVAKLTCHKVMIFLFNRVDKLIPRYRRPGCHDWLKGSLFCLSEWFIMMS